jgi:nucleoid-associated protein YgaU
MSLEDKYRTVLAFARANEISNMKVREESGVLYVEGSVPTQGVVDQMRQICQKIDPNAGDFVMNLQVATEAPGPSDVYMVKSGDTLEKIAARYPGVRWEDIVRANKEIPEEDMMKPGQVLQIPAEQP